MNSQADVKAVTVSEKLFRQLLTAYPPAHREEYGEPMAQLFRDQCRDAWNESHGWGLTKLWLRVLPDVVATSFSEHLETIKQRKFMSNRSGFRLAQFLTVFAAVFLLVVFTATIITFILPEMFVGAARVLVRKNAALTSSVPGRADSEMGDYDPYLIQTEFEIIQSQVVLTTVIEQLSLHERWGKKYQNGERLTTPETIAMLKHMLEVRPIRNTSLIEIRGYSEKPDEAAQIANSVAEAYRDYTLQANQPSKPVVSVTIVDRAMPSLAPLRPNKPLNIALGVVAGIILGLIAASGVAGISFLSRRNVPPKTA